MKRLLGFVRKEFIHIIRDPLTLIILFGIPAALIMLFGFVISTELKDTRLSVFDLARDETSRKVSDKIFASGFFLRGKTLSSYGEIDQELKSHKSKAVIVFEPDFGKKLMREGNSAVSIFTDASEPNVALQITSFISAIILDYNQELTGKFMNSAQLIQPEVRMLYNPALESHFMFIPGLITLIMILICALMTSITLTREKEFGTMEVLLVSPLKPYQIIMGKVVPYFLLSFIDVLIILLLSYFVFGMGVKGSLPLLLAELMLYILMSLSLGILISSKVKNMQQAIFITLVGGMLPTVLLSGFIFPIESMPDIYGWISSVFPPRYFIVIIKNIMIKGTGFGHIWKETLILLMFTMLFIVISIRSFKLRLQ